jgi:uracil-DNA glycosylase
MTNLLDEPWKTLLSAEFEQAYFKELETFVSQSYTNGKPRVYPPKEQLFAAFNACNWEDLKVVVLGQDPYHGDNQANGLCFSVNDYVPIPRSLFNIFEEIRRSLGHAVPLTGNLEHWAKQGVLLLNATLTVSQGQAGSHQRKGWERFTDAVIQKISDEKENIVFLLWGNYAQQKGKNIDAEKHLVLKSGHPSPLSANQGKWFGNNHFVRTNEYLNEIGKQPIEWELI